MEQAIAQSMPHGVPNSSAEYWRRRNAQAAVARVELDRRRTQAMESYRGQREAARAERERIDAERRRESEERARAANEERRRRDAEYARQQAERQQAYEQYLRDNPNIAERENRRAQAEARWADEQRAVDAAERWHVVYWAGRFVPCTPVDQILPGSTSPESALALIQRTDPDAYQFEHPGHWEQIIRTRGYNLRMVKTRGHCRLWLHICMDINC
jgi:hypothetical protein